MKVRFNLIYKYGTVSLSSNIIHEKKKAATSSAGKPVAKVIYFKLFGVKIFHFFTMWCVWRRKEEGRMKEERRLDGNAPWQPVEPWMLTLQHVLQYQLYCSTTEKHCVMYLSMIITWHQTWTLNDKVVVLIPPTLDSIAFDRKRKNTSG